MRNLLGMIIAGAIMTGPAFAGESEPHFAAFDVTQSPAPRAHAIGALDVGGRSVTLNAYGRKALAHKRGDAAEMERAKQLSGAFDPAARPAVVTFEASVSF